MNNPTAVLAVLGKRGHVIQEPLESAGIRCSFTKSISGPRRILGVIKDLITQLSAGTNQYTAVISDNLEYLPLANFIAKLIKKPLIARVRGDVWAELQQDLIKKRYDHIILRFLVGRYESALKDSAAIVPVSNYLGNNISRHISVNKNVIKTIPVSVDSNRFAPASRTAALDALGLQGMQILLTVTNFRFPEKIRGILDYSSALKKTLNSYPSLRFYIAGDGPYRETFEQELYMQLGSASSQVTFLGLTRSIDEYYRAATAVLHLTQLDSYARVVIEAQSSGRIVIANRYGALPDLISDGETGYLVSSNRELELKLQPILDSTAPIEKIEKASRSYILAHNQTRIIGEQWLSLLKELT